MLADGLSNIDRIVLILRAFVPDNIPLTSAALYRVSGSTKSRFHGLLRALCDGGWLERVAHGKYRLGPRATELALLPSLPPAPARITAPKPAPLKVIEPGSPKPHLPLMHPDLLEMRNTFGFQRLGAVRIGFANASLANPWRSALLQSVLSQARLQSTRIARLAIRHAGDDPVLQVQQIRQMVDEGLDALIISACDDRDLILSSEINCVAASGIPIVAVDRRPKEMSGVVSFVTASDRTIGAMSALWMAEHLGGRGIVWMLSGRHDAVPAMRRLEGARMVIEQFPELTADLVEFTDWTEDGGYFAAERLFKETGIFPAGVWCDSGLHGIGSVRWFIKHQGKAPPHTGGDQNLMYKLCLSHQIPFAAIDYPYSMGEQALSTTLDILAGRPVPKRLEVPLKIVMPRGLQTKSVIPDVWAEAHVGWNDPDDVMLPRSRIAPKVRR